MESQKTGDDSFTLKHPELGVHYHSVHGAWTETQHVFGNHGLRAVASTWADKTEPIRVLEVGLGTGLNVLCALTVAKELGVEVVMESLEPHPLRWEDVAPLGYPELTGLPEGILKAIHEQGQFKVEGFEFHRTDAGVMEANLIERHFDVIFFDAFAPTAEAHMWTVEVMDAMRHCLKPGGHLVTYCAKGSVRRNMGSAGFLVERLDGPPGKREMMRAIRVNQPTGQINVRSYMILVRDGASGPEVLLSYERLPRWGGVMKFPGGGLEWGEGTAACLRREALEELGQPVAIKRLCHVSEQAYVSSFDPNQQVMAIHYEVELLGEARFEADGELSDVFGRDVPMMHQVLGWRAVEGLDSADFSFASDREAWAAWLNGRGQ